MQSRQKKLLPKLILIRKKTMENKPVTLHYLLKILALPDRKTFWWKW